MNDTITEETVKQFTDEEAAQEALKAAQEFFTPETSAA